MVLTICASFCVLVVDMVEILDLDEADEVQENVVATQSSGIMFSLKPCNQLMSSRKNFRKRVCGKS